MFSRLPGSLRTPVWRRLSLPPALMPAAGLSARSLVRAGMQLANNTVPAMYRDGDAGMRVGTSGPGPAVGGRCGNDDCDMRPTPDKRRRFSADERPYSLS